MNYTFTKLCIVLAATQNNEIKHAFIYPKEIESWGYYPPYD